MIASVYIKDKNIHLYNSGANLSRIGGIAYELGKPLLDFVCYEPERFDDGFAMIAETFDNEFAHAAVRNPVFMEGLRQMMGELQQKEIYLFFYTQMLMDFIFDFIDTTPLPIPDKEKQLFRAAKECIEGMSEDIRRRQAYMISEIELLLSFREVMETPKISSMEYLYHLEEYRRGKTGLYFYMENPLRSFYGVTKPPEIVEFYEIDEIEDLFRFEFVKMIEHDIFIKKCKNCERFFIPKRRADVEYCERIFGSNNRKCSEIGATLRHEKKVAGNPILEAHKKAYRRFNSRTRAKKMTQNEFLQWSEEAAKKRDECLAGTLPFDEFVAWLEQGRIRKGRG